MLPPGELTQTLKIVVRPYQSMLSIVNINITSISINFGQIVDSSNQYMLPIDVNQQLKYS